MYYHIYISVFIKIVQALNLSNIEYKVIQMLFQGLYCFPGLLYYFG